MLNREEMFVKGDWKGSKTVVRVGSYWFEKMLEAKRRTLST